MYAPSPPSKRMETPPRESVASTAATKSSSGLLPPSIVSRARLSSVRMDDGIEYTKEQFLAHYGGTEEWDVALKAQQAVENERPPPRVSVRMDDGIEYTKEQFLAHYGGTEEWDAASRRMMESGAAAADGNDAGADVPDWDALRSTSVPIGRPIGKFDKYRECESRRVFFRNRDTGATSWDAPVAPDAAPDVGITAAVVGIATEAPSAPPSALLSGPLPPMVAAASSVKDDGGVCLFLCIFMTEYCQPYSTNIILLIYTHPRRCAP